MSIKVMSWVWENSKTSGSKKLVLLALADNANDEGKCWPGISTIARKCGVSRAYVKKIIKELKEEKEIEIAHRPGPNGINSTNLYTVLMGGVTLDTPIGNPGYRGGYPGLPTVGDPSYPEPSYNHQLTIIKEEEEGDDFTRLRDLFITLTGIPPSPKDVATINKCLELNITEEDIRAALQWRVDNGLKGVKTISQLMGGIETNRSMRIQATSARPGKNGKQKENYPDYTLAGEP